jgi:hypothetical protein
MLSIILVLRVTKANITFIHPTHIDWNFPGDRNIAVNSTLALRSSQISEEFR